MKTLLSTAILLATLVGMSACAPKSQEACGFLQNVYGERVSWKSNLPVKLAVHDTVPDDYLASLQAAASTWNRVSGKNLIEIQPGKIHTVNEPSKDGINVIYFSNTWEESLMTQQGRTAAYWIGDQMQEADIKINAAKSAEGASVYNFYDSNVSPANSSSAINVEALFLHELGHMLGLTHKDNSGSVMDTYLPNNTNRTSPSEADITNLKCEY